MSADTHFSEIAAELWSRRDEGVRIQRQSCVLKTGTLVPQSCHSNVQAWIAENPNHKSIRGWLIIDCQAGALFIGEQPYIDFLAHSVVEDVGGGLIDITPTLDPTAGTYPFLRHPGDIAQFEEMVGGWNLVRLRFRISGNSVQVAYFDS
jgi:hypothetical protein